MNILSCVYHIAQGPIMLKLLSLEKNENLKVMVVSLNRPSSAYYSSRSAFCCNLYFISIVRLSDQRQSWQKMIGGKLLTQVFSIIMEKNENWSAGE